MHPISKEINRFHILIMSMLLARNLVLVSHKITQFDFIYKFGFAKTGSRRRYRV